MRRDADTNLTERSIDGAGPPEADRSHGAGSAGYRRVSGRRFTLAGLSTGDDVGKRRDENRQLCVPDDQHLGVRFELPHDGEGKAAGFDVFDVGQRSAHETGNKWQFVAFTGEPSPSPFRLIGTGVLHEPTRGWKGRRLRYISSGRRFCWCPDPLRECAAQEWPQLEAGGAEAKLLD
jgi:hypothetical protein